MIPNLRVSRYGVRAARAWISKFLDALSRIFNAASCKCWGWGYAIAPDAEDEQWM